MRKAVTPQSIGHRRGRLMAAWAALLLAAICAYSNHFRNGFHFDDVHTVIENRAIRNIGGIPTFFIDIATFSRYPPGRSYRPIVTASLAVDSALGGGLNPLWFHLSTFCWFILYLFLIHTLYKVVLDRCLPAPSNTWTALFGTAIYGLHPACAETVNYVIQRGDLYVSLGIVGTVVMYARKPVWRRWCLYLIPALFALFSKPTGVVFALFLLAYSVLLDSGSPKKPRQTGATYLSWAVRIGPALLLSAAFLVIEKAVTPPQFFSTTFKSSDYWLTQPYVTLRYFRSFFLPLFLNVDSDLKPFHSLWSMDAWMGIAFCAALVALAIVTARHEQWRAVSFGLWWFFIGLLPTAVYPLNEVENDHRMFLPFVGLGLAAISTAGIFLRRAPSWLVRAAVLGGLLLVISLAWGTHQRNRVWASDATLWADDIQKSPNNARGHDQLGAALVNLGRLEDGLVEFRTALRIEPKFANAHVNIGKALMQMPGRLPEAIEEFEAALRLDPSSPEAKVNLGAALGRIPGREREAIPHLRSAIDILPDFVEAHYNLGVVLAHMPGSADEAISEYKKALELRPDYAEAYRGVGNILERAGKLSEAMPYYTEALRLKPDFVELHTDLARMAAARPDAAASMTDLEAFVRKNPESPETHYYLAVAFSKLPGRASAAIQEFRIAIRLKPDYADAHTSLGIVLSQSPGSDQEAVAEFQEQVRLQPDLAEAHTNLGLALSRIPGQRQQAIAEFEKAFRLRPDPALRQTIEFFRTKKGSP